ncbi:MAG: prepilin-type N-terminal cleavage/methylation domain-containing protein [Kiritimatiellia bacterium]
MSRVPPRIRPSGFTFVELLLALALGALVAAILGTLVHGLFAAGEGQSDRLRGPFAARATLRHLSRELACAFAPPVEGLRPLRLAVSTEVGQPETVLSFYVPVPGPLGYDVEQVTYEIAPTRGPRREWRRISAPCSGPRTNAPVTNVLYEGRFALAVEVLADGAAHAVWPPPQGETPPGLPASVRLTLALPGQEPWQTEVLIQAATGIRCPIERDDSRAPAATNAPAGE